MTTKFLRELKKAIAAAAVACSLVAGQSISPAAAGDQVPIKIGFTSTESGPLAPLIAPTLIARQLWAEEVNARGGILGRPVVLVVEDDKYNPGLVPTLYSKLLDIDKVDVVVGPFGNAVTMPILPLMEQHNKLFFSTWATTANTKDKYDKYFVMGPWGETAEGYQGIYSALAAENNYKKIALLSVDIEGPQVMVQQARTVATKLGLEIVYDQKYPVGTVEFSSPLRAINSAKPDAVYIASTPPDSIAIISQLDEVGLADSVKMCCGGMVGLQTAQILQKLGPKVNGLVNYSVYVPAKTMQYKGTQQFFDRYTERAKQAGVDQLGYYGASFAYAQCQIIEQAIVATKSTDDAVLAKYMHATAFDTIVGKIVFDEDGEWAKSKVVFIQFRGVKGHDLDQFRSPEHQIVVAPAEFKSGDQVPLAEGRK